MTRTGSRRSTCRKSTRWKDLTPGQQTALLTLASVQVSLAATAGAPGGARNNDSARSGEPLVIAYERL